MNETQEYRWLVNDLLVKKHGMTLQELGNECLAILWQEGVSTEEAANWLYEHLIKFKEN